VKSSLNTSASRNIKLLPSFSNVVVGRLHNVSVALHCCSQHSQATFVSAVMFPIPSLQTDAISPLNAKLWSKNNVSVTERNDGMRLNKQQGENFEIRIPKDQSKRTKFGQPDQLSRNNPSKFIAI
jgi:hypothetical protein